MNLVHKSSMAGTIAWSINLTNVLDIISRYSYNNIMNTRLKVTTNRILMALFIGLVFLTPLIFSGATAEMYEFPKMTFVYTMGSTIVAVWLVSRLLWGGKKLVLPRPEVLGFVLVIMLSVAFSSHLYTSLWGYYSRFNGGLMSLTVFFGIYMVGLNFFDQKRLEVIKDILCLGLLPVSLYGIFQILKYDRVFSTLGQPNWLAAYTIFLLPLLLNRILSSQEELKRNFWLATFLLSLICLWFTHSLSGLAGFLVGMLYLVFSSKKVMFKKWMIPPVVVLGLVIFFNYSYFKARMMDALVFSQDPGSYRVSDPGLIRMGLWKGSLRMAVSSPKNFLLGTGPETFPYEYPFFREDIINYSSEWDFILNKPHNYYLELLVESGVLSLFFYLLVVGKALKKGNVFLNAGLIGFLVSNIFGWPTVATSLIFWLWLVLARKSTSP